jgi:hypothetical protein
MERPARDRNGVGIPSGFPLVQTPRITRVSARGARAAYERSRSMTSNMMWVGLDAHKKAINVAVLLGREPKPQRTFPTQYGHAALHRAIGVTCVYQSDSSSKRPALFRTRTGRTDLRERIHARAPEDVTRHVIRRHAVGNDKLDALSKEIKVPCVVLSHSHLSSREVHATDASEFHRHRISAKRLGHSNEALVSDHNLFLASATFHTSK